jgi:hypothetical protein
MNPTISAKLIFLTTFATGLNTFQSSLYAQQALRNKWPKQVSGAVHWYEKKITKGPNDTYFTNQNKPAWKLTLTSQQKNGSLLKVPVYQKDALIRVLYINVVNGNYSGTVKEFYKRNEKQTEITTYTVNGTMVEDGHISEKGVYEIDWSAQHDAIIRKAKATADTNVYVTTYVLKARDKEILRKINAEDDASDAMANTDCQGRDTPGNKPFRGTMEYWLIKIDFLTSGLGNKRVADYHVPLTRVSDNNDYVDLTDVTTHEMFIIKPDDPEQISAGKTDLSTLVAAAKQSCGGEWRIGTAFDEKVIPNGKGANLRLRLVRGTGVVAFIVQSKTSK